jgi:hypothetical protein
VDGGETPLWGGEEDATTQVLAVVALPALPDYTTRSDGVGWGGGVGVGPHQLVGAAETGHGRESPAVGASRVQVSRFQSAPSVVSLV